MSYSHLFYTSSEVGIFRSLGYQIFNVSENVSEEDRHFIVRYGAYKLPAYLEQLADVQEIVQRSPKIFSTNVLPSGKMSMTHGVYVGLDYSNRKGNYFTHTVSFQHERQTNYPFEYFGSAHFKEGLTPEEQRMTAVEHYLPTTSYFEEGHIISRERVQQFLQEPGRVALLEKMVASAIAYSESRKKLVVVDERAHIPFWIAAVHYCFPVKLAWELTFTTCVDHPNNSSAVICGVESASYGNGSWKSYFQTFNVQTGELPDVTVGTYARMTVAQLAAGESLHTFFELNEVSVLTTELNNVSPLSYLLADDVTPFLTKDGFLTLLKNYFEKRDNELFIELTEHLTMMLMHDELQKHVQDVSVAQAQQLADSFFNIANENGRVRQVAIWFVYQYANNLLKKAVSAQDVTQYKQFLATLWAKYSDVRTFIAFGYSGARLEKLRDMIEQLTALQWEAMFGTVIDNVLVAQEEYDDTLIATYFTHLIDRGLDKSFSFMHVLPEMFEHVEVERLSILRYMELCTTPNELFLDQQQQLKKIVAQLKQLSVMQPTYRWKYEDYVSRYPQVEQLVREQLWEQIHEQSNPVTFVIEQCMPVLPVGHEQERYLNEAVHTVVEKRINVVSEFQKLVTIDLWKALPEGTIRDIVRVALEEIGKMPTLQPNKGLLDMIQKDIIEPRQLVSNDAEMVRFQQEIDGLLLLDSWKWQQTFTQEEFDSLLQLHIAMPTQVEQFMTGKVTHFINSSKSEPFYLRHVIAFFMKKRRAELFRYFTLVRTPLSMTTEIAIYFEQLLKNELTLTEEEIQLVNESKLLKKLEEEMEPPVYSQLKEQLGKGKNKLLDKILSIASFKKGKKV